MADTKVSNFPPSAGLVLTDIFPVVDDPGGTPEAQKATFTQLATLLGTGNFVLKAGDTMTGALVHPVGAVGTPSTTFTGDLNTGIYHPAADFVGFSAGGTQILNLTSTGPNVGQVNVTGDFNVSINTNLGGALIADASGNVQISGLVLSTPTEFLVARNYQQLVDFNIYFYDGVPDDNVPQFTFNTTLGFPRFGIFNAANTFGLMSGVAQQSATDLASVIAALKAYGWLAP